MEIHKRLGETNGYQTKIKKMYEIWMSKLAWMKKNPKKVPMIFPSLLFISHIVASDAIWW